MKKGLLLMLACVLPCPAHAQPTEPLWEFGMGATGLRIPDYRGSDQNRYYALPIPYFVYRGDKVRVDRQGPRAKVFESERLELDFSAFITPPVDSSKNHAREGMPDLDATIELGPQINYIVARDLAKDWRFDLRMPVRAVVATDIRQTHGAGYTVFPHAYYSGHPELFGARWNLGLTAGLLFGSRDYHAYFYSVAPQFATAERPAYDAPGGYSGAAVSGSLGRRFGKLWAGGFVRYDNLHGAAFEPSPLVRQNYSLIAGVAFAWVFAESKERVAGREF